MSISTSLPVELRDLKWVIAVSQYRSLRQAAQSLDVRQSTLSRRIRDIECRLDIVLFERTNGGTHLTRLGVEFVVSAKRILYDVDRELRRLKSKSRGELGLLTIGVHASPSVGNMHAALAEYHRRFPDVDLRTVDGSRDRLLCALTDNVVDVAIIASHASAWDGRVLPLWSERVIVAFPEQHQLGHNSRIGWTDFANEKFLVPQQGPGPELEGLLAVKLRHTAHSVRVVHQDSSLDRLLSLVSANYGTLLMFEGATGMRHEGVAYREVWDDDGPTQVNFMAYWREMNTNPTLGSFLAMLRESYPDFSAEPNLT